MHKFTKIATLSRLSDIYLLARLVTDDDEEWTVSSFDAIIDESSDAFIYFLPHLSLSLSLSLSGLF